MDAGTTKWLVALAALPALGPRRLHALLHAAGTARRAWADVLGGRAIRYPEVASLIGRRAEDVGREWTRAGRAIDPDRLWIRHRDAGVEVLEPGNARYPTVLAADPEPPPLIFVLGAVEVLEGPRVAVVGTRRCTAYGRDVAFELGRELAAAGVGVVSGLALGIDASAHAGALEGGTRPPIAVVATGLDVVYPKRNGPLWRQVAARGLLLSEYPLGVPPLPWRFPARNRLVAALADIVVVVESHARGGSLYTVEEAMRRDRPVLAVPGSVRSPASRGAIDLIADGCAPVRDTGDVLVALGLSSSTVTSHPPRSEVAPDHARVLDALGDEPATLEHLAVRTGFAVRDLTAHLYALATLGVVTEEGGWYERRR